MIQFKWVIVLKPNIIIWWRNWKIILCVLSKVWYGNNNFCIFSWTAQKFPKLVCEKNSFCCWLGKKLTTRWRSDCEFHISLHHFIQTLWNVSICKWRKNFVPQIFIQIIEMFFWSTLIVNLYHPPLRRGVECQIKGRINQRKRD